MPMTIRHWTCPFSIPLQFQLLIFNKSQDILQLSRLWLKCFVGLIALLAFLEYCCVRSSWYTPIWTMSWSTFCNGIFDSWYKANFQITWSITRARHQAHYDLDNLQYGICKWDMLHISLTIHQHIQCEMCVDKGAP